MMHADREQPGRWYLKGLVLPGGRKSVDSMAARVQPERVRSAHQSMHHLVAEADWSDEAMLAALDRHTLPPDLSMAQKHKKSDTPQFSVHSTSTPAPVLLWLNTMSFVGQLRARQC
jgi:hypothetical protein